MAAKFRSKNDRQLQTQKLEIYKIPCSCGKVYISQTGYHISNQIITEATKITDTSTTSTTKTVKGYAKSLNLILSTTQLTNEDKTSQSIPQNLLLTQPSITSFITSFPNTWPHYSPPLLTMCTLKIPSSPLFLNTMLISYLTAASSSTLPISSITFHAPPTP